MSVSLLYIHDLYSNQILIHIQRSVGTQISGNDIGENMFYRRNVSPICRDNAWIFLLWGAMIEYN